MTVRVGVVGVGMIGQDHIRRLTTGAVRGGRRRGVRCGHRRGPRRSRAGCADAAGARHRRGAGRRRPASTRWWSAPGARPTSSTCWPRSPPASRCSARSRWPPRQEACRRILDAEAAAGRRLVQVGYMRRYDAGVPRAARGRDRTARIGAAAAHALRPPQPERAGLLPTDESIDHRHRGARDRHGAVAVRRGDRGGAGAARRGAAGTAGDLQDPLVLLLETGQRDAGRRRGVGQHPLRLRHPRRGRRRERHGGAGRAVPVQVRRRRARSPTGCRPTGGSGSSARTTSSCRSGSTRSAGDGRLGPSAWDGYAATAVSDAGLEALRTGARVPVALADRPALYDEVRRPA